MFERFPRDFEQQALLWIHACGFARRDTEKCGIELVDRRLEEPGMLGVRRTDTR